MADGIVARLKIVLGIDSAEVTKGARKADAEVSKMSKGMATAAKFAAGALGAIGATFTVDAIMRITKAALAYTVAIKDQAREAGVTARALQEYRYAALQAGVADDELADGLKELTLKLGEAAGGSKSATAIFEDYGVAIRDANDEVRNSDDVLPELADAFNRLKTPAEQLAFATRLFGEEAGPKMAKLLAQGSAGMMNYRQAAHELGMVISDVNIEKAEKAEIKMKALNKVLSAKISSFVAENADEIANLVDQLLKLATAALKAADGWMKWQREVDKKHQVKLDELTEQGYKRSPGVFFDTYSKPSGPVARVRPKTGADRKPAEKDWPWWRIRSVGDQKSNAMDGGLFGATNWGMFAPGVGSANWITDAANDYATMERSAASVAADTGIFAERAAAAEKGLGDIANASAPAMLRQFGQLKLDMADTAAAAELILSRLFPEQAERRLYDRELTILNAFFDEQISKGGEALEIERQRVAAVEALHRAYLGLDRERIGAAPGDLYPQVELVDGQRTIEEMNGDILDSTERTLGKIGEDAETLRVRFVGSFAQMVDGSLREIDRFVRGIKTGNWLDIVGGLLNAIDGIAALVTGGKGASIGPFTFGNGSSGSVPRFASGGAMRLGGLSGVDRNLLSLNGVPLARTSAGETMTITPANDRGMGGGRPYFDLRGAVMTEDLLRQMNGMVASGIAEASPAIAGAGARQALGAIRQVQQRSLG